MRGILSSVGLCVGARGRYSSIRALAAALALSLAIAFALTPDRALAQAPQFSATKSLCAGNVINPATCAPTQNVFANTPVFYVFQVTGLPGSPQQTITISEFNGSANVWPAGFVPTGLNCSVPATFGAATMQFILTPGTTVTCTAAGYFSVPASGTISVTNTAHVTSTQSPMQTIGWNTSVHASAPLGTNIAIAKSASVPLVNAPGNVTYTVTITNTGPNFVTLAPWFVFHDSLALLPNSVPLNANLTGWQCTFNGNPCPASSLSSINYPQLIGTSAPHPFFDWAYPASFGQFNVGDHITLTFTVQYSVVTGLTCKKLPGTPDGLNNTAFFTLTSGGAALYDSVATDNTAFANVTVDTGATTVNPNCGDGQLSIRKVQTSPTTTPVAWGTPVSYDLIIQNTSLPAQPIQISGGAIQDLVSEGVNTPPFTRHFVSEACNSNQAGLCAAVLPGVGSPPFQYSYYTQSNLAWQTNPLSAPVVLQYNKILTLHLTFKYRNPDCDAVPLANPKPIPNTVTVDYLAPPVGAPTTAPSVQFHQQASVTTYMEPPNVCAFQVLKKLVSGGPGHFGLPALVYNVSYINHDAPRTIGTIADMLRTTDINYASPLTFSATWTCTQTGGVTGPFANSTGAMPGQAIFTGAPSQGAIVMVQPPNIAQPPIFFPHNASLNCTIKIIVNRPPYGSTNCSAIPTDLENAAIMDTTRPYNPSGFWPPSGSYNPAAPSNPNPQDKDWATVQTPLPKCFDLIVNKSASVAGVSPPWTYVGGPQIDYTITATNPTNSLLLGQPGIPTWNGLILTDAVSVPYASNTVLQSASPCVGMGCVSLPSAPNTQAVGIASLAAQSSGDWHLSVQGPFTAGQSVNNCVHVNISGDYNNANDWYSNFNPNQPLPNAQTSCVSVPVLDTRPLSVLKRITNATGATVYFATNPSFAVQATCVPYSLPTSQSSGTIAMTIAGSPLLNGATSVSLPWVVQNAPVADQCTVSETPPALPHLVKQPCPTGTTLQWATSYSPAQPITISGTQVNTVFIDNKLYCQKQVQSSLTLIKDFTNGTPASIGFVAGFSQQTFTVDVNCTGQPPLLGVPLVTPATSNTTTTSSSPPNQVFSGLPVGTQCLVQENPNPPPMPAIAYKICRAHNYGLPVWVVTTTPAQPFNLAAGNNVVHISNDVICQPFPHTTLDVYKLFKNLTGSSAQIGPLNFGVQVLCTNTPTTNLSLQTPATSATSVSAAGTVTGIPVGATCIASEPGLNTNGLNQYCNANGVAGTAYWVTTYSPSSTVTTNASGNALTIENDLMCRPTLVVTKEFDDATGSPLQFPIQSFNVQIACTGAPTATPPPLQTPATSTTSTSSPAFVTTGLTVGAQCQPTENPAPAIPAIAYKACQTGNGGGVPFWTTTFIPGANFTLGAGMNALLVKNVIACGPATADHLLMIKDFDNQTLFPQLLAQSGPITFNVQVSCSDGSNFVQPLTVPPTATQSSSPLTQTGSYALGTTCTFVENPPAIPPGAMQACQDPSGIQGIPTWTTTYSPTTATVVAGGVTETVTNTLSCVMPPHAPQQGGPPSAKIAPSPGRGAAPPQQPQPQCSRTSVNGEEQTTCTCPKGTELKNGKCAKKESVLDDILGHVTIGVGVGVGGGTKGGSHPSGQGKPKQGDGENSQNGENGENGRE